MFFLFVGYSSLLTIYISCTIAALLTGRKLWQKQAQGGKPICWNWLGVRGKEENRGKDPLSYSFRFQLTNHHKSPNHDFNPLQTVSSLLQSCLLFNWYPSHPPLSKIELTCLVLLLLPLDLFYSFSTLSLSLVTREEMQRTDLCLFLILQKSDFAISFRLMYCLFCLSLFQGLYREAGEAWEQRLHCRELMLCLQTSYMHLEEAQNQLRELEPVRLRFVQEFSVRPVWIILLD